MVAEYIYKCFMVLDFINDNNPAAVSSNMIFSLHINKTQTCVRALESAFTIHTLENAAIIHNFGRCLDGARHKERHRGGGGGGAEGGEQYQPLHPLPDSSLSDHLSSADP